MMSGGGGMRLLVSARGRAASLLGSGTPPPTHLGPHCPCAALPRCPWMQPMRY